jgi:hypothetical protein
MNGGRCLGADGNSLSQDRSADDALRKDSVRAIVPA